MPRKSSPHIVRPSGIESNPNETAFFWKCNASGQVTFADPIRFKEIVEKYGSEENLFKTYVLRSAQKYLDAGYAVEQIRALSVKHGGKLPRFSETESIPNAVVSPVIAVRTVKKAATSADVGTPVPSDRIELPKPVVYPWSANPDYFKSPPRPFDVAEESKTTCIYPNHHLDTECHGCPVYDQCRCELKLGEAAWKNPVKRNQVVKKAINSFNVD